MARSPAIIGITGSTARVNNACANTTSTTILRPGRIAVSGGLMFPQPVKFHEPAQQEFELLERNHIRAIGRCLVRILMSFNKHSCNPDSDRRARENADKLPLSARRRPLPARLLDRVGGIKDDRRPRRTGGVTERAHIV